MTQTANRLQNLRTAMAQTGTDLVVLGPGAHMHWLLGFHPHGDERPCLLMIGREQEVFLMPALNAQGTRTETDIAFCEWADENGPDEALKKALGMLGAEAASKVVLDETMRADFALLVLGALPGASHDFTLDTVGALRMRKDADEYARLKENAAIDDRAMQAAWAALRPGITELDVADVIRAEFTRHGAKPEFTIVGSGPNGAFPHHATGNRKLQAGDAIVIDIGGRKDGFPSDMTRMAIIGQPPEGYEEVHAIVERAVCAALDAARPGVKAMDVDAAARNVIAQAGYGEFFVHRLGHGLGIEVHEPPFLTSTSETVLDEGMVFSIEPGIYLPGRFGLRLEDIVILHADGPEILSSLPRDMHVVPV